MAFIRRWSRWTHEYTDRSGTGHCARFDGVRERSLVARERKGHLAQVEELMQEGAAFASTLVGMNLASATAGAEQRSFKVQIVPPSGELTFDLNPKRMRLQVDDAGIVTWAHAG